jgi:hypothetical protein
MKAPTPLRAPQPFPAKPGGSSVRSSSEGSKVSYEANAHRRAPNWQLSSAIVFALLRERHFEIDTIPKPGGLDSGGPRGRLSVRSLSDFCPELVRPLSGAF